MYELGVPIADNRVDRIIGYQVGTSFAAPYVANMAAQVQARYPDFRANLIRGLLVNSAEWPNALSLKPLKHPLSDSSNEQIRHNLQLFGYGVPQRNKIIAANEHCIVFYGTNQFDWTDKADMNAAKKAWRGKLSFFGVDIDRDSMARPDLLAEKVKVSVTLSYMPPTRLSHRDYQGVELQWHLRPPDEDSANFQKRLMYREKGEPKPDGKHNFSKWKWELGKVLGNPPYRKGTVVKDWFITRLGNLPHEFEIGMLAYVKPWLKPPQPLNLPFALVMSIESVNQRIPLYDLLKVRTSIRTKVRS